jgi:hypothetical protein
VPGWLKRQPQLVLQVGLNMAVPIYDLDVGEQAISGTLSFNRSPFFCRVPWSSVWGLVGEDGRSRIWPDDVPIEIAAQMQQQAAKAAAKAERNQARGRLRNVGAGASTAETPGVPAKVETPRPAASRDTEPDISESAEARPQPKVVPADPSSPRVQPKRKLPSYLRVVK